MNSKELIEYLKGLGVDVLAQEHEPLLRMTDTIGVIQLPGVECKNLFVCDRKKRHHFLLVTDAWTRVDLRALGK